jgi:hypothetical protein
MAGPLEQHPCRGCNEPIPERIPFCARCKARLNVAGKCGYCGQRPLTNKPGQRSRLSRYCKLCQQLLSDLAETELLPDVAERARRVAELQRLHQAQLKGAHECP